MQKSQNNTRILIGCYLSNICMAVVANISPLLFVTFIDLYDISYTLLGFLIFINFTTQLGVDLIFSFFSHKFNIEKTVKCMPLITFSGLFIYSVFPLLFPNFAYIGLLVGTVVFSASSGLAEVLISPVVAELPTPNKDRALSALHAMYAWGVVGTVLFSTAFLFIFGSENWHLLCLVFLVLPCTAFLLFRGTIFPQMTSPEKAEKVFALLKNRYLLLCIFAIFLGGASEVVIAQWSSSFFETVLNFPKIYGDVFAVAAFAAAMGVGRSLYSKRGTNIHKTMTIGASLATICYVILALSPSPVICLVACWVAGFGVAMLWPGSLVLAANEFPHGGVAIFALMAVGGDMGAAIVPQAVGVLADLALSNPVLLNFANTFALSPEQFALKFAILMATPVPLIGVFVYFKAWKHSLAASKNNK